MDQPDSQPYQPTENKAYDPASIEPAIYQRWAESGAFKPIDDKAAKPFCIINPPTNANGALHIGHAVGVTLQDLMTRYHRMKGEAALWLPGFDHAGFETQVVYEKLLEKEGRNRFEIDRAELYREMYDFTQSKRHTMIGQFAKLGASMDWSREMFTLNPAVVEFVYQTFKDLYDDGLVYRGTRPVHWCVKHQTSLSDLEVRYEERTDPLYYMRYGPLVLATVRPETKFGDTAVAVHPDDQRYQSYIGQEIEFESLIGPAKLKVIADPYVNPEFGTGVVKITPAHDPNDFEIAKRHNLPSVEVIDRWGKLNEKAGPYAGLKIAAAREKIVADLTERGLMEKVDQSYRHSVGLCYKCGSVIEPRVLPQWFIAMTKTGQSGKNLRDDAVAAVRAEAVRFVSPKFANLYFAWMKELRDWNISRQIVWGIQLPIWYCEKAECQPIVTDGSTPEVCPTCGGNRLERDPDVFDTWFSSGQWPMAALAANSSADLERFYPTSVMETAYDILFFWVARMIMLGLYRTGQVPFKEIYIHGLVRDKERQKMSKSRGNVIDPLGIAEQYGSDAVRLALIFGTSAGNDIVISEEKIRGMRNFANKLWNIARFIRLNLADRQYEMSELAEVKPASAADQQLTKGLAELERTVTEQLDNRQFHLAAEALYEFAWHQYADIYLEEAKKQMDDNTRALLLATLLRQLCLLHPFMPFITEAIYQSLPITGRLMADSRDDKANGAPALLMMARWPEQPTA